VVSYAFWLASIIFYDALIVSVSSSDDVDKVSGLGFSLGYIGSALLFSVNVAMTLKPEFFGLEGAVQAVKLSFLCVSAWWIVFTIPLILKVPEPKGEKTPFSIIAKEGLQRVIQTFSEIRKHEIAFLFLLAYWFYIDGVDTVVVMAVDYGKSIGLETSDLITALLLVQYVAFPFAYLFGWMGQKFGAKRFIFIGVGVYILIVFLASFSLDSGSYSIFGFSVGKFLAIAFLIGTVQGGVQALSRSYFSRLIPAERSAEFFGFYNMVGKFAVIIGPVLIGTVGRLSGNPRIGIFSIIILFIIGGAFLVKVHFLEKASIKT
ncbi:MAG: MFS transporter, partial [Spirochaetia bacterium]|nr:MFS transporter [Spirochaetia bacterium]